MNTIMIEKRGYKSALSACPAAAAAFTGALPAQARPHVAVSGYCVVDRRRTPLQGTGLSVAGKFAATQCINDVPTMLFQPHPGDTARRPPA